MNTMLRNAGFLQRIETSKYEITEEGLSFLSAAYGGEK
jgi:predicted transcriptional regulator